jgi:hypothetical protein
MKAVLAILAMAAAGCSGRLETYFVSPDGSHVLVGNTTASFRSIEVATGNEVGNIDDVSPTDATFSNDGSWVLLRSADRGIVVAPTVGSGRPAAYRQAIDPGRLSPDGSRVAFLSNPVPCSRFQCAGIYTVPTAGGVPVLVASGIQVDVSDDASLALGFVNHYEFATSDTLVFTNIEGSEPQFVPADGSASPAHLFPTSTWFVLDDGRVLVRDATGLLVIGARGGAATRVYQGEIEEMTCGAFRCRISAGGSLAVIKSFGAPSEIVIASVTGKAPFSITALHFFGFDGDGDFAFVDETGSLSRASPTGAIAHAGSIPEADLSPQSTAAGERESPDGKWLLLFARDPFVLRPGGPPPPPARLKMVSLVDGSSWTVQSGGKPFPVGDANDVSVSPDSEQLLLRSPDRRLAVVPISGGEPRFIDSEVDQASWAGPDHIVVNRTRSSPAGVHIVRVR